VDQEEAEWNMNIYKGRRIERQIVKSIILVGNGEKEDAVK
jgi:hypothetical protein